MLSDLRFCEMIVRGFDLTIFVVVAVLVHDSLGVEVFVAHVHD